MSGDFEGILETAGAAAVEAAVLAGTARTHCPNCGAKFTGPYCADCGQERDTHRRTIANLLGDFFEDILSFDSRILRTARALVAQPGELSCAFREGRTRAYVPPIRLYFFVTLLFFLILSFSGIAIMKLEITAQKLTAQDISKIQTQVKEAQEKANNKLAERGASGISIKIGEGGGPQKPGYYPSMRTHFFAPIDTGPKAVSPHVQEALANMHGDFDAARAAMAKKGETGGMSEWVLTHLQSAMITLAHDPTAVNGPLMTWIPRALFLLLPIFAALLALFHWRQRKGYFFVDHLVFSLNAHSFAFVVLIAAVWLAQIVTGGAVGWLALLAVSAYVLIAMKRFYGQSWTWASVKFVLLSLTYAVFFLIPALVGVVAVSVFQT